MKAAIITFSKGRRHHLAQSLPLMLAQDAATLKSAGISRYCVVVVDYGCPDDSFGLACDIGRVANGSATGGIKSDKCAPLTAIKCLSERTTELNRSHARNIGGRTAIQRESADLLAFVDADALLHPHWLAEFAKPVIDREASIVTPNWTASKQPKEHGVGICVVHRRTFTEVRGFDESMRGWGWEDSDFWMRCRACGHGPAERRPGTLIEMIRHKNDERVAFHAEKKIAASRERNTMITAHRGAAKVNPSGYGHYAYEVEIWSSESNRTEAA